MHRYLLIAVGGACGSMLRYFIGATAAEHFGSLFPLGTFSINILACFLIGLVLEYLNRHTDLDPAWRFLIPVGFIGAFSTFSTFEWEAWADVNRGAFWAATLYIASSVFLGLLAVGPGVAAARFFGHAFLHAWPRL